MKIIDAAGKPCPIPVIEAKKTMALPETRELLIKVDNKIAVQNLKKMADGFGYTLSFDESGEGLFEVAIRK